MDGMIHACMDGVDDGSVITNHTVHADDLSRIVSRGKDTVVMVQSIDGG
jgi:hypothetical protein